MVVGGRHDESAMRGGGGNAHARADPIFGATRQPSARLGAARACTVDGPGGAISVEPRIPQRAYLVLNPPRDLRILRF